MQIDTTTTPTGPAEEPADDMDQYGDDLMKELEEQAMVALEAEQPESEVQTYYMKYDQVISEISDLCS